MLNEYIDRALRIISEGPVTADPDTETKPATKPDTDKPAKSPTKNPDPFKPPRPKKAPEPKNAIVLEAYEDEVNQANRDFWGNLPKNRKHIFAKHPIMAMHGDKLSRASYEHTAGRLQKHGAPKDQQEAMRLMMGIMRIEAQHEAELEQMAIKIVAQIWGIPEERLRASLTRNVDINATSGGEDDDQAAVAMDPTLAKHINKRITMNTISQGSAVHNMMTAHYLVDKALQAVDPRLIDLYNKITASAHYQYWLWDIQAIAEMIAGGAVGSAKVEYDQEGTPVVQGKAICFPVLVQELSKGVSEIISHHGLADLDEKQTETVLKYADRIEDEPWLIQVGPELWRRFLKVAPKEVGIAQVLTALAQKEPDEVHDIISAVVEDPENAALMLRELVENPQEFEPPQEFSESKDEPKTRMDLPRQYIEQLLACPESGMGYQCVKVTFEDGTTQDCVVFNSREVEVPVSCAGRPIKTVVFKESVGTHTPNPLPLSNKDMGIYDSCAICRRHDIAPTNPPVAEAKYQNIKLDPASPEWVGITCQYEGGCWKQVTWFVEGSAYCDEHAKIVRQMLSGL